ncbi:DNA alkylation repair protein [Anaerovibrio sp. RM50]|uniref:DNA alkylation repair protein n=1 Tax=Anaerovibrio sp. RM50 TaxID=1200557 RepID=UPI000A564170|nr:DNA alkylation repair protein [Anaerovibrio sp. RM50]
MNIQEKLFSLQDLKYRDFHAKLVPGIDKDRIIGVRVPDLRKLAKEIPLEDAKAFMGELPHKYIEENNLHGFIISNMKDFEAVIRELEAFLPHVDNWGTCDLISPKIFKKHLDELLPYIDKWLQSQETYTIRFGIEMLMSFYLDADFKSEYLEKVAKIRSEEYYVRMMVAWYFATALAKQYDASIGYIEQYRLEDWTHRKTIQKAVESRRLTPEQKNYLKTFSITNK